MSKIISLRLKYNVQEKFNVKLWNWKLIQKSVITSWIQPPTNTKINKLVSIFPSSDTEIALSQNKK